MKVSALNIPFPKQCESGIFLLPAGPCVLESEEMSLRIAGEVVRLDNLLKELTLIKTSIKTL